MFASSAPISGMHRFVKFPGNHIHTAAWAILSSQSEACRFSLDNTLASNTAEHTLLFLFSSAEVSCEKPSAELALLHKRASFL